MDMLLSAVALALLCLAAWLLYKRYTARYRSEEPLEARDIQEEEEETEVTLEASPPETLKED